MDLNSLSDQELEALSKGDLNSLSDKALSVISSNTSQPKEPGIIDKVFNIPGAAVRSAIQGNGYSKGAQNYQDVPKFQDQAIQGANDLMTKMGVDKLPQPVNEGVRAFGGMAPSAAGLAADMATNPADLLTALTGHIAEKTLAQTAVGQAVANVMNKEHRLVKFGGNQALRDAAVQAKSALGKIDETFGEQYKQLFDQIGANRTPATDLHKTIVNSIDKTFDNSPTEKFLTKIMDDNPHSISADDLHSLRQQIASKIPNNVLNGKVKPDTEQSALLDVWNQARTMLEQQHMGGDTYKALTSEFANHQKNVAGYIRQMILDRMGKPTETGLARYGSQPQNVKDAMEALQASIPQRQPFQPSTGQTMIPDINAINRQMAAAKLTGQVAKHALIWGGPAAAVTVGLRKLFHGSSGD